jgi:transposase-like protein
MLLRIIIRYKQKTRERMKMTNLLMNCYYDGMTVKQAKEFIERNYKEEVTEKALNKVKQKILNNTNKEWK